MLYALEEDYAPAERFVAAVERIADDAPNARYRDALLALARALRDRVDGF